MNKKKIKLGSYKIKTAQFGDGLVSEVFGSEQVHSDFQSIFDNIEKKIVMEIALKNSIDLDDFNLYELEQYVWRNNGRPQAQFIFEFDINVTAKKVEFINPWKEIR